jgi:iron complex transport system substrate-binding protein
LEEISGDVLDCALQLHRDFGPGLLENVYGVILAATLQERNYAVETQKKIDIRYKQLVIPSVMRVDMLVDTKLLVEIKSVEQISPVHAKQVLTYLRLMNLSAGLLINFGGDTIKGNVRRVVNGYTPFASPRLRVNQKSVVNEPASGGLQ